MSKLYILTGPDKAQSFDLRGDTIYIGRSPHNNIQMKDRAVSRRHLKLSSRRNRYFIKDLKSENGTFVSGREISSGVEFEIKEGIPVVIGMSVICLGEKCLEYVVPFLDSIELSKEIRENSGVFLQHKTMTTEKIMELVYKVSDLPTQNLNVNEILEKILDYIFDFLRKIDRGVIILIDPQTGDFTKVTSRLREPGDDATAVYSRDVVERVIQEGKGVMVSDVHAEDEEDLADTLKLSKIESVMCVPLISGSQITGVIYVDSVKEPYGFRREDLSLFTDLGRRAALAIDNALLYGDLEKSA